MVTRAVKAAVAPRALATPTDLEPEAVEAICDEQAESALASVDLLAERAEKRIWFLFEASRGGHTS